MASQVKKLRSKREKVLSLLLLSVIVGILALLQNKYGRLSDIRSFYGMHFFDGQHLWPYSEKTLMGETKVQHPVEYPALTGLIMWLLSFLVFSTDTAITDYYRITAGFQIALFTLSAYFIFKLVGKKFAFYFILAPAVAYSLNRNWDIWAVVTMLIAIYFFDKKKFSLSAILLAISIATKFFPVVLMLPIMIIFIRNRQIKEFLKYVATTLLSWILINVPFILIDFSGWAYFYKFSAERGLGSASIYEITDIIFPKLEFDSIHFYILNLFALASVTLFLIKLKNSPSLTAVSFFVMFGFILFNKQYSMQYVIWLAALAVLSIAQLKKKHRDYFIYVYVSWQSAEFAFQYAFYQRILTDAYANTSTPMSISVSNTTYAYFGVVRYLLAIVFALLLARLLYLADYDSNSSKKSSIA